jgi:hypothetical protein
LGWRLSLHDSPTCSICSGLLHDGSRGPSTSSTKRNFLCLMGVGCWIRFLNRIGPDACLGSLLPHFRFPVQPLVSYRCFHICQKFYSSYGRTYKGPYHHQQLFFGLISISEYMDWTAWAFLLFCSFEHHVLYHSFCCTYI